MTEPIVIIGIGVDGLNSLSPQARRYLENADEIWASARLLRLLPKGSATHVKLDKDIRASLRALANRPPDKRIVLLASGDPGFFGLGSTVLTCLPADQVVLIPAVSTLQTAFARAKLAWDEAHFTSAHGRSLAEVIGYAKRFRHLGILTDPVNNPARIAAALLAAQIPDCRAIVLENLGDTSERLLDTRLSHLLDKSFADPNVLLVLQDKLSCNLYAPRPDDAYVHRRGLITKADIRTLCLSRLALGETDIVWDIGAGSGAMSIEIAERVWRGHVYAIERDAECLGYIRENLKRYGCLNVTVVEGTAPEVLVDLATPNAVFIGGTGGRLEAILTAIEKLSRSACRVVASFAQIENAVLGYRWMHSHGWQPELAHVQLAYGVPLSEGTRLVPANPVMLLTGTVGGASEPK